MSFFVLMAVAAIQAPPANAPGGPTPAVAQSGESGVTAYPPSFFASASPTSAYDMVIRLPGFTFDKGAAVRGLADAGGNVLVDSQPPVAKNDTLDEILKRIPAGAVARIELIRGGAPGIDMQGRTVVANVVRKTTGGFRAAVMPSTNFIYDGRVLNSLRAEAQWRWSGGRSAELSQVYGKGPSEELGDGSRVRYNANQTVRLKSNVDADAGGQRIWTTGAFETPLAGGRARFTGAYLLNPSYVELYDRYVGGGREYEYDRIDRRQIELGGRYSRALTAKLGLEAVGFQQFNDSQTSVHFEAPGLVRDFSLDRTGSESVGRLTFKLRASARLTLEGDVEGALNKLDSKTDLIVNKVVSVVPAANVQIQEKRAELTLRATWRASDSLSLESGLRAERSTVTSRGDVALERTLQFFKPRVAATWAPDPDSQVRLRVEREVGQLNFDDFVAAPGVASTGVLAAGNPDLAPQQDWVAEAAYERRFWSGGAVVLTARHYTIDNVVDRIPIFSMSGAVLADVPGNIGRGTKDEYQAAVTLPLDRLGVHAAQVRAQATRRITVVVDPLTGRSREISVARFTQDTRDLSGLGPWGWDAHFTQDLPKLKAVWGVDVIGAARERTFKLTEIETRKVGTEIVVFTEFKPRPDLTIRLEGQTINQRHVKRIREDYLGPRNLGVLDYTDVRDLKWGGSLYIRVRKAFGG